MTPPSPVKLLFGALLMAVGGLIALLSGACSTLILVTSVASLFSYPSGVDSLLSTVLMVAVFGGVPLAVGVVIFIAGRKMRH